MKPRQFIHPEYAAILSQQGLDSVAGAFAYSGGELLTKPGLGTRERLRLTLQGPNEPQIVYMKRYMAATWRQRLSCDSLAWREMRNIQLCHSAGVPTMQCLAAGHENGRSYILMSTVPGQSLEKCFAEFWTARRSDAEAMRAFNQALVAVVARLHGAGLIHRDLYASHIFMDSTSSPALYLIDLARVFKPRWRLFRWRVKDLAALAYSMPEEWVAGHWDDFLAAYVDRLGQANPHRWQRAVAAKVAWMQRRRQRKAVRP
jgi:tRNA A-37 threonylcarbamoyl transferase component Bud32